MKHCTKGKASSFFSKLLLYYTDYQLNTKYSTIDTLYFYTPIKLLLAKADNFKRKFNNDI